MKTGLFAAIALAAVVTGISCTEASAQQCGGFGAAGYPWMPYGFYQPYGAHYGSSLRTPPYFALNPPVYYGTRYSRPYGLSPFAAPPVMNAPASYEGRVSHRFVSPPVTNPYMSLPCPQCSTSSSTSGDLEVRQPISVSEQVVGAVRTNPFVEQASRVASR